MGVQQIIVEGPDCSGKSTLVNQLKNALCWDAKALGHQDGNQFSRYFKEYALQECVVFDRSHFSEAVYARLWKRKQPFSKDEKALLDSFCELKTLIIFACPDLSVVKKRYQSRLYVQQIKLSELRRARELFREEFKGKKVLIYHSKNFDELRKLIIKVRGLV